MPPPIRRPRPRRRTRPAAASQAAPTGPPIAPIAVSPRTLRELSAPERRRWMVAATVTGAMLSPHPIVRDGGVLSGLPDEVLAAFEAAGGEQAETITVTAANLQRDQADAPVRATPVAHDEQATEEGGSGERSGERSGEGGDGALDGALPDGPFELARAGAVTLVTEGSVVELVGFHESAAADAVELTSTNPVASEHPSVDADVAGGDGPVLVLPTRERAGGPMSAIDLALRPGAAVPAPVSGEVVEVADFALYGSTRDVLVTIRAAADPRTLVTTMHLVDAEVEAGDVVEAGVTPIASEARRLPFRSQIDRFAAAHRGQDSPHVHIELRRE